MAVTPGTWNLFGINIPDFGWTEKYAPQLGVNPNRGASMAQWTNPYPQGVSNAVRNIQPVQPPPYNPPPNIPPPYNQQQTQQQQTGGGGGLNVGDKRSGGPTGQEKWTGNEWVTDWGVQGGGGGGQGGGFDLNAALNEAYAPAYQNLNAIESSYRSRYPEMQSEIGQQYTSALAPIGTAEQGQIGLLGEQRTKGQQEEQSQIAQARQLYNELRVGGLTRYGGASSTGEAYGELLGRETTKQMAGIGTNFQNYQANIAKEELSTHKYYADKVLELNQKKTDTLNELRRDYDDKIREINSQRYTLDSQKNQQKLEALQELSKEARQKQAQLDTWNRDLANWKQIKDQAISDAKAYGAKSFTVPSYTGSGFSIGPSTITSPAASSTNYQWVLDEDKKRMAAAGYVYNAQTGGWVRSYAPTSSTITSFNEAGEPLDANGNVIK